MRLGLFSDTFGNLVALERALDVFEREKAERVFFLGGWAADVDAVLAQRQIGPRNAPELVTEGGGGLAAAETDVSRSLRPGVDPLSQKLLRIASRACPEYQRGEVPLKEVDLVEGRVVCLVHDKAELTRDDIENASLILHGNSSGPAIVPIGSRCFVTPGHLRSPAPDGRPATFVLVDAGLREVEMTVFGENGAELRREKVVLANSLKMKVR